MFAPPMLDFIRCFRPMLSLDIVIALSNGRSLSRMAAFYDSTGQGAKKGCGGFGDRDRCLIGQCWKNRDTRENVYG